MNLVAGPWSTNLVFVDAFALPRYFVGPMAIWMVIAREVYLSGLMHEETLGTNSMIRQQFRYHPYSYGYEHPITPYEYGSWPNGSIVCLRWYSNIVGTAVDFVDCTAEVIPRHLERSMFC